MAAKPTTTAEQREEIIESLKAGVVPSVIAAKLKLTYESVRWIGVKNGIKVARQYKPNPNKTVGRWQNLEARMDGSGYY